MSTKITKIETEEILDSRGNPTIQVDVYVEDIEGSRGISDRVGSFSVPSGASTGEHEAHELRDGDKEHFNGKGVKKAIENIKTIIEPALKGKEVTNQKEIDDTMLELDGTKNKSKLGGNATVGVSIACAKAAAVVKGKEVYEYLPELAEIKHSREYPLLYMNLINGGKHAESKLAFQEYHVVPHVDTIAESLEIGTEIQYELQKLIVEKYGNESANIGNEGGFAVNTESVTEPLELMERAAENIGHKDKIKFALDVAASSFYENDKYMFNGKEYSTQEFLEFYRDLIKRFPFVSIEDPFHENDFDSFGAFMAEQGAPLIVGDDLTVTSAEILQKAIDQKSINAIIIKPNQIGTLTETLATMKLARENDVECIVSHRSGETNDDFIADLAYAFGVFGIKAGAPRRGERLAKLNRLKHIESALK